MSRPCDLEVDLYFCRWTEATSGSSSRPTRASATWTVPHQATSASTRSASLTQRVRPRHTFDGLCYGACNRGRLHKTPAHLTAVPGVSYCALVGCLRVGRARPQRRLGVEAALRQRCLRQKILHQWHAYFPALQGGAKLCCCAGAGGFISPDWLTYGEIMNGRFAMLGAAGMVAPEILGGAGIIPQVRRKHTYSL